MEIWDSLITDDPDDGLSRTAAAELLFHYFTKVGARDLFAARRRPDQRLIQAFCIDLLCREYHFAVIAIQLQDQAGETSKDFGP